MRKPGEGPEELERSPQGDVGLGGVLLQRLAGLTHSPPACEECLGCESGPEGPRPPKLWRAAPSNASCYNHIHSLGS